MKLMWIPSHTSGKENELVANEAGNKNNWTSQNIHYINIFGMMRSMIRKKWCRVFQNNCMRKAVR